MAIQKTDENKDYQRERLSCDIKETNFIRFVGLDRDKNQGNKLPSIGSLSRQNIRRDCQPRKFLVHQLLTPKYTF